jgi:hypothetical protein
MLPSGFTTTVVGSRVGVSIAGARIRVCGSMAMSRVRHVQFHDGGLGGGREVPQRIGGGSCNIDDVGGNGNYVRREGDYGGEGYNLHPRQPRWR